MTDSFIGSPSSSNLCHPDLFGPSPLVLNTVLALGWLLVKALRTNIYAYISELYLMEMNIERDIFKRQR